jgi:predicted dehydrogenase
MSKELEGNVEVFDDFKALVDSGKVNAVSICTPPVAHEDAAVYALSKGVHVLLEKPQAHSVQSAKNICEAASKSDAKLMMAFRHRFLPAIQKMKSIIDEGKIGKVVFFQNIFCGPAFHMKDKWFTKKAVSGGGCILDTSSHSVDLFRYLVGEIVEQKAVMHTHFEGTDVEDAGIITVKAENGALGQMTSSFVAGDGIAFVDITGQDGRVVYDYLNSAELKYKKRGESEWEIMEVKPSFGFGEQIGLFAKAIKDNQEVPSSAKDGLRDIEIIQANY